MMDSFCALGLRKRRVDRASAGTEAPADADAVRTLHDKRLQLGSSCNKFLPVRSQPDRFGRFHSGWPVAVESQAGRILTVVQKKVDNRSHS